MNHGLKEEVYSKIGYAGFIEDSDRSISKIIRKVLNDLGKK